MLEIDFLADETLLKIGEDFLDQTINNIGDQELDSSISAIR